MEFVKMILAVAVIMNLMVFWAVIREGRDG